MFNCNEVITAYTRETDPDTGNAIYTGTTINGVSVHTESKVALSTDGLLHSNVSFVRIPYVSVNGGHTPVAEGDIIVVGGDPAIHPTEAEIRRNHKPSNVLLVVSVTDNTKKLCGHWKVMCK